MMLKIKVICVKLLIPFLDLHFCESIVQKGHREICESDQLEKIRKARKEITDHENKVNSNSKIGSFNEFYTTAEILDCISQRKINLLITGNRFTKSLSIATGTGTKIWYPMPKPWMEIVSANGLSINHRISRIMYLILKIALYLKACKELFILNLNNALFQKSEFFENNQWIQEKIVVVGASSQVIAAHSVEHQPLENFRNWLKNTPELAMKLHLNNIEQQHLFGWTPECLMESEIISLAMRLKIFTRIFKLFYFRDPRIGFSLFLYLKYSELTSVLGVLSSIAQTSGKIVIFNNSHGISKPLWANLYERNGDRVSLFFYSAEEAPPFLSSSVATDDFWQLSRWKEYWVIDETQRVNILNALCDHKVNFYIVGVPWWSDIERPIEFTQLKSIAFFDFEPQVGHFGLTTYNSYGYQYPQQLMELLEMVVSECAKVNVVLRHKPKREIGIKRYREYEDILQVLTERYPKNYRLIDSRISPSRLIRESDACISLAFTSTAIIARDQGRPSVYFSNSKPMSLNHARELTIKCINSPDSLRTWINLEVICDK